MSTDQVGSIVPLPHRGLQLDPPRESHYFNSRMSPSPDSSRDFSNLCDTKAIGSPDINMPEEYCVNEESPEDNPYNTSLPQGDVFSCVSMNLNQSLIDTPVNDSVYVWNENFSLVGNQEMQSEKYETFHKNPEDRSNSTATSSDSVGNESQLSSCEISWRGSSEKSSFSLSSGEMLIRSNSFGLEDQSLLVVSSLDESSVPSTPLPDVCENFTERIVEKNLSHPCLGMTFIKTDHSEFLTEENLTTSISLITLPNENEGGLLMTFVCDTSSESIGKEAKFASDAELLQHFSGAITPEQGKSFVSTVLATQETGKDIHTSTPVQNIGEKKPSLPSFLESPCTGNTSSPGINSVGEKPISVTPKEHIVAGLPLSASQVKTIEIKSVPKSDFSSIKSKVVTRSGHQIAVLSPTSSHLKSPYMSLNNKHTEANKGASVRISPTKVRNALTTKIENCAQRRMNTGVANLGMTVMQSSAHTAENNRAAPPDHPALNKHGLAIQHSNASSKAEQVVLSHVQDAGNQTFCFSSLGKSPDRSRQMDPKVTAKKCLSDKIEVRSGSALGQDKPPVLKTRPRFSSENSSSRPPKEKRISSSTIPKGDIRPGQTKAGKLNCSSQNKRTNQADISNRAESSKSATEGSSCNESKTRFRVGPSPRGKRETLLSQPLAASQRPATLSTRQRQGVLGRDECRISRAVATPQSKPKNNAVSQRVQATEPSFGNASSASNKHQLNRSQPLQTPTRPSFMGPPLTPASKIPRKTPRPSRTLAEAGLHRELGEGARSAQVSGGAVHKQTPSRAALFKARHISTPGKNTQPTLATACKPAASTSKRVLNSAVSPLIKTTPAKLVSLTSYRPSYVMVSEALPVKHPRASHSQRFTPFSNIQLLSGCRKNTMVFQAVDKNKSKATTCQQLPRQQVSQLNQSNGPPDVVPASAAEVERKNHRIQKLRGLLEASNHRFEAIAVVLQQTLAKNEEAKRRSSELSQELVNLQGELVCSIHSSECLEKEKEELCLALEDALQKLHDQHQKDLTELEQKLHAFYQTEWDKIHLSYQEEADKCKTLMQQQIGELKSSHEAMKLELQSSHTEELHRVKQQYEISLEEVKKAHNDELQSLENTLRHTEASMSGQIQELTVENNALNEKLTAEENIRKELDEKSQKDSHTLYLEQELESLKVVLDIKNKQLHQQEKKLMEIDKLTDKNVKLDENLKKIQQENEDFRARMERHAALSRQLSTEQAMLQESLQKESKVNKRLSMENEELLWKLHNGDLGSPRKVSPTSTSPFHSPSHSFSFQ